MKYISLLLITTAANLICNGDFEAYSLSFLATNTQSAMVASDTQCWYDQAGQDIQIKRLFAPETTQAAQLSTDNGPYTLCQNPNIAPGINYRLSYALYAPEKTISMLLRVSLNNKILSTLEIQNQNQFGFQSVDFFTDRWFNWLCFHEIHQISGIHESNQMLDLIGIGGFLDNVSLIQIPIPAPINQPNNTNIPINNTNSSEESINTKLTSINLAIETKELSSELYLISDAGFQGWMTVHLANNTDILFQRYQQQYFVAFNQKGNLVFVVKVDSSNISEIEIRTHNFYYQGFLMQVEFKVEQKQFYFRLLDQSQKNIIENVSVITQTIAELIHQISSIVSASLSSYFILSLLNLWNLSLMYSFLPIEAMPNFCREIYEVMMNLSYNNSSIVNWLLVAFNLSESDLQADFQKKLTEYMSNEDYLKLYKLGFSSKILLNNLESFLIVGMLIAKIFIAKIIFRYCPQIWKQVLNIQFNCKIIFFSEIIQASPFILLSASVAMKESVYIWEQRMQKIFQLMLFLICLLMLPLWSIYKFEELRKIDRKIKQTTNKKTEIQQQCLKIRKIEEQVLEQKIKAWQIKKSKQKILMKCSLYEFYLNISVPVLIVLKNTSFFMIMNCFILIARTRYLIKNVEHLDFLDRFFAIGSTIIWIVHHLAFYLLFLLGKPNVFPILSSYLGIVIILTVIGGVFLQIFNVICDFIVFFIQIIRNLRNRCCINRIHDAKEPIKAKIKQKSENSVIEIQNGNIFDKSCTNSPNKADKQPEIQKYYFKVESLNSDVIRLKKIQQNYFKSKRNMLI